jgi:hypothetical protein
MKEKYLSGVRQIADKRIKINVQVLIFKEDNVYLAYMPSLELTGYGYNEDEAKGSLEIVLDEFLSYTLNKGTFFIELERLGWGIKSKKRPIKAPEISDLINTNKQLRNIVNKKQFTASNYPVNVPAFA